jgi:hypothetical protein
MTEPGESRLSSATAIGRQPPASLRIQLRLTPKADGERELISYFFRRTFN